MSHKVSPQTSQVELSETQERHDSLDKQPEKRASTAEPDDVTVKHKSHVDDTRYDIVLWMFGILALCVIIALMFGLGELRGWDAPSPYTHNLTNSSVARFLPEPLTPEPGVYKRSDAAASQRWYYWKLRPEMVTVWTKFFVWVCYSLHNLSVWLVLYLQHRDKAFAVKSKKYTTTPSKYNYALFGLNVFFHIMHLINTHTTYDATAADTSEASSQSSVIVALILILAIEFQERGIVLGFPFTKQLHPFRDSIWLSPVYLIRKYHGYFIYWAAIYTFWYHPMENTVGHAMGFSHTFFLMLQGSLAFQEIHKNKYWRLLLEVWVALHGGIVAVQTQSDVPGAELWPMFLFGFLTVLFLTQLYGLPLWQRLPRWSPVIALTSYLVVVVVCYDSIKDAQGRSFVRIAEIIRIPGIYYLMLLAAWLIVVALIKIESVIRKRSASDKSSQTDRPSALKQTVIITLVIITYLICILVSWVLEFYDWKVMLFVLTMIYCFTFMLLAIISFYLLKFIIPLKKVY